MKKDNHIPDNFENKLDEFAPKLSSVNNENPFNVPADYFETLPEKITAKFSAHTAEHSFNANFRFIFNPRLYIPVAVLVLIVVLMIVKTPIMKTTNNSQLAQNNVENSIEYQYVDSLIDNGDIDEAMLMETITGVDDTSKSNQATSNLENNIPDMNKSTVVMSDSLRKVVITDDDIIQYLLDNDDNDDIIDY